MGTGGGTRSPASPGGRRGVAAAPAASFRQGCSQGPLLGTGWFLLVPLSWVFVLVLLVTPWGTFPGHPLPCWGDGQHPGGGGRVPPPCPHPKPRGERGESSLRANTRG